jgi:hypothetical protein
MKMYDELASWWPLLSPAADYEEEAAFYQREIERASAGPLNTMLEIGSGGGHNASHLKRRFASSAASRWCWSSRRME